MSGAPDGIATTEEPVPGPVNSSGVEEVKVDATTGARDVQAVEAGIRSLTRPRADQKTNSGNGATEAPMAGAEKTEEVEQHAVGWMVCDTQTTFPEDENKAVVVPPVRPPIAARFDILCPEAYQVEASAAHSEHAFWEQGLVPDLPAIRSRAEQYGKHVAICFLNNRQECF